MAKAKKKANSKARSNTIKAKSNDNNIKAKASTNVRNEIKKTSSTNKNGTKQANNKVTTSEKKSEKVIITKEDTNKNLQKEEKKPKIVVTAQDKELSKTKTITIKELPIRPEVKKNVQKKQEEKLKESSKSLKTIKELPIGPEIKKKVEKKQDDTKKGKKVTTSPSLPTREEIRDAKNKLKETNTNLPSREEVRIKKEESPKKKEETKVFVSVSPKKEFKAEIKPDTKEEEKLVKKTKKLATSRSNNQTIKMGKKTLEDIKKQNKEEKENTPLVKTVVKKRRKLKVRNLIIMIMFLASISMVAVSAVYLIGWEKDNKNTKKVTEEIIKETPITEVEDNDNTVIIESKEPKGNDYWDFIKLNLMSVDFTELKTKNPDTKGWIRVEGTNINYPFVQTNNNEYYLYRSFDKSYNGAGWIFLDYENDINNLGQNTILYGHGRLDTTMFGSLKNIFRTDWYNNSNNHIVKLSTETENTLWQVFSVYIIPNTNDYIQTSFATDSQYQQFLNLIKGRSQLDFNASVTTSDKILTLSTCYNTDDKKVVLHAKLIKKEAR